MNGNPKVKGSLERKLEPELRMLAGVKTHLEDSWKRGHLTCSFV